MPANPQSGYFPIGDGPTLHTVGYDHGQGHAMTAQTRLSSPLMDSKDDVAFNAIGNAPHIRADDHGNLDQDFTAMLQEDSNLESYNDGVRSSMIVNEAYTPGYHLIDPELFGHSGSSLGGDESEGCDPDIVGSQTSGVHSECTLSFYGSSQGEQICPVPPRSRYVPILAMNIIPPSTSNSTQSLQVPSRIHGRSVSTSDLRLTTSGNVTHVELARQHVCATCGTKLKDKNGLKQHVRKMHSNPRAPTNECPIQGCVKKFLYPKDRDRHVLTHGGPKSYHCHRCQKEFGRRDHLKRHLANPNIHELSREQIDQHLEDEEKPIRDAWSQSSAC